MIKPPELNTPRGDEIWRVLTASAEGDVLVLREMLERDPTLSRESYWYTSPVHFAVREGHAEAVQLLLDAGADAEWNGYYGQSLEAMARERGHEDIARILQNTRSKRGRTPAAEVGVDHPIHIAAEFGDVRSVRKLLNADSMLLNKRDAAGGTPLHRAVIGGAHKVIELLLDRGADIHAVHGTNHGAPCGYWPYDIQAIDLAIWGGRRSTIRQSQWKFFIQCIRNVMRRAPGRGPAFRIARLLIARGAAYDLAIASALGDIDRVREMLDADPSRIREARPNGRRPLPSAVEFGHEAIARLLLECGADPAWPEIDAERGSALHIASSRGNVPLIRLLLAHGADPNAHVNAGGNSMFVAKTPEIRSLLQAHGGMLDPYDLVWLGEDDEVMRRVNEDPRTAELGCGGVFTAVCTKGNRELLQRLLNAGIRVPPVLTGCQSYLLEQPDMLQTLLEHGMNPDTCNWENQTMLHILCAGGAQGEHSVACARMLLDAGANISARDDAYRSTPLAWAARHNRPELVDFFLSRGARTNLPDDRPWATPLAWASRSGHARIVEMLRAAGAAS